MIGKLPLKIALALAALASFVVLTLVAQSQQPLFWDNSTTLTLFFAGFAVISAMVWGMRLVWLKRPEKSRLAFYLIIGAGSFLLYDILVRTGGGVKLFETPLFPVSLYQFLEESGIMFQPEQTGFNDLAGIFLMAAAACLLVLCAKEFCGKCSWKHLLPVACAAVIFQPLLLLEFPAGSAVRLLIVLWLLIRSARLPAGPAKAIFCALSGIAALLAAALVKDLWFFVLISVCAVILYCCRRNWKSGIVPAIIFITGGLLAALSLYAFAEVDVLRYCRAFQISIGREMFPVWEKVFFIGTPLAMVVVITGIIYGKYRFFSTRLNVSGWIAVIVTLAVSMCCTSISHYVMWVALLWMTTSFARVLRTKDRLPILQYFTGLYGQGILILILIVHSA